MPELPEVETIRMGLKEQAVNLKVLKIDIYNQKSFQGNPQNFFNLTIKDIFRRGKMLGIEFENDRVLVIHLKMSGQLIFVPSKIKKNRSTIYNLKRYEALFHKQIRVIITFDNGSKLYFNDQRKFGWIREFPSLQKAIDDIFGNLGPEPLEDNFSFDDFRRSLQKRGKTAIKVALMDQHLIVGIGNIYSSEALFLARINPVKKIEQLSQSEIKKLFDSMRKVLLMGIAQKGASRSHFVNERGEKGNFLNVAKVYNREGKPCFTCGNLIENIILNGRSSFYCSRCQM